MLFLIMLAVFFTSNSVDSYMKFGDFNGDGKMDYMWMPVGQGFWNVAYSTGNGFNIVQNVIPVNVGGYKSYHTGAQWMQTGDFNGDGKMDYMWIPDGQEFWNVRTQPEPDLI